MKKEKSTQLRDISKKCLARALSKIPKSKVFSPEIICFKAAVRKSFNGLRLIDSAEEHKHNEPATEEFFSELFEKLLIYYIDQDQKKQTQAIFVRALG